MPTAQVVTRDDVGECKHHSRPFTSRCLNCKIWMCDVCVSNHKTAASEGECDIIPAFYAMRVIKETQLKSTNLQIHRLNNLKGDLLAKIALLNERKKKSQILIATLKEELLQLEVNIRGIEHRKIVADEKMSQVQSWIETLLDSRSSTFLAETVEGVEISQEETNRYLKEAATWIDYEGRVNDDVEEDTNCSLPRAPGPVGLEYLKQRVLMSQHLYTIDQSEDGESKWAKIDICGQDIIVHAHTTDPPPKRATIVPYKELTDAMPSLPCAFFDIFFGNEYQGRVSFKFFSVNPRSLQHLLLCMGDWGPCFKGTVLMPHGLSYLMNETEQSPSDTSILYGGNYSQKPTDGCPALYDNVKDGGEFTRPILPGLLAGITSSDDKYLAMYKIYLEAKEGKRYCNTAFGQVTSGLALLEASAKKLQETKVIVADCGLSFLAW